ncbi:MAG: ABC transporter ATP-binding protein [Micromonosporaceae bacterium]
MRSGPEPGARGAPGLRLTDLRAGYADALVLRGIDLTVARGELLVLLGPSGAGKSTLLRVVAGLEPALGGRVHIAGRDVTRWRPGRRNVSMVFQSYALFPHLTVADNIRFGLRVRDVPRAEVAQRTRQAAAAVGCEDLLRRRPGQLSGGERQRVALARALARQPDVFLLDEPLSNLDAERRGQTRTELRALHDRIGATMLHVTHDQTEALLLGDRVAVLRDGMLEQVGAPEQIWRTPRTRFVAQFVGSPAMNLLPADGPLTAPGVPRAANRQIGIRAEGLRLADSESGADGTLGVVERCEILGDDTYVHVRLNGDRLDSDGLGGGHAVVARVPTSERPDPGTQLSVTARPEHVHVFDTDSGLRITAPAGGSG